MQNLSELKKGDSLHHFNIIEGSNIDAITQTCGTVLDFNIHGNPNYFYKKYDTFLIDDARELTQLQNLKHKTGESAVFVLECGAINVSSQNALLKVLEETKPETYFFMMLPQSNILLPTFLSRAVVYQTEFVDLDNSTEDEIKFEFPNYEDLKNMLIVDRMKLVTKWLDQYKKEKIQKSDMKKFLNSLKTEIHNKGLTGNPELIKKLDKINQVSDLFDINGAHIKSILEFIVLTI
jgi:DNA polymerase III delta prime subunit